MGGGGHSEAILEKLSPQGRLIAIDWDEEVLRIAATRLAKFGERVQIVEGNFADIPRILSELAIDGVDGIVLDLGISSFQIESARRGFSYLLPGPLDMRMSEKLPKTAAEIINESSFEELVRIFKSYGEERRSRKIATAIIEAREKNQLQRTEELAKIIAQSVPITERIKTQSRVFQAIRIATNHELENLRSFLDQCLSVINKGGRLVIISFHSLEDRIVKEFMKYQANPCQCPPELPECVCGKKPTLKILTRRAIKPTDEEIALNPRARSARLRAAEII